MMVFASEKDTEEDIPMQLEGESNLDKMAHRLQNVFKFRHVYDQIDFSPEQRLAITKAILKLANPSESCGLDEKRLKRSNRFEDSAIMF